MMQRASRQHQSCMNRINGGQHQLEHGRHNPYDKPLLGHVLSLSDSLKFVPYAAPLMNMPGAHYFAEDLHEHYVERSTWLFIGQVSTELYPSQMAKLLVGTVGVSPLVVQFDKTGSCMFANLRSKNDVNKVLYWLTGRLLLDYDGAWFATDDRGEDTLVAEARTHRLPNLPSHPVTFEKCVSPPRDWWFLAPPPPPHAAAVLTLNHQAVVNNVIAPL